MRKNKFILMVSMPVLLISAVLLTTGSSVLLLAVREDPYVPLGSIIAWTGIIALPTAIYFGISDLQNPTFIIERILKYVLLSIIAIAVFWAPISYWLSGNFAFSFTARPGFRGSNLASKIFWYFNYFIVLTPIICLMAYWIYKYSLHIFKIAKD